MSKPVENLKRLIRTIGAAKTARDPEKKPEVKSVMQQTFFTSLLCLVLSVTMFFGTSYAWFTNEVNNTDNEIYIGTLDVGFFKETGTDTDPVPVDLAGSNEKLFDKNICWEPGYTALETVQVVNEGDLTFDYELLFTDGKDTAPTGSTLKLEDVAQFFDVWVYGHQEEKELKLTSYADITTEDSGWVKAGTLDELLSGKPVLKGTMTQNPKATQTVTEGEAQTQEPADRYTIALHMKDDADATVMGHRIGLNVKLVAYQRMQEKDGFGQTNYADFTTVSGAVALKDGLLGGKQILMLANIGLDELEECVVMNGGVLDGNNNTITYTGGRNTSDGSVGVVTTNGGIVRNLKIEGGENGRALYMTKLSADLNVSGCTFGGAYAFNLSSAEKTEYAITFSNTVFKSWTSYANAMKHAYFTGCTFEGTLKPYGDTTLTDCTFKEETLDLSSLENGETVKLINCTYDGVAGINAELTRNGELVVTRGYEQVKISSQSKLILNK